MPALKSFIAYDAACPFPLENLPWGVFRPINSDAPGSVGVAIGEYVLDLKALAEAGVDLGFPDARAIFGQPSLNAYLAKGVDVWKSTRSALQALLGADSPVLRDDSALRARVLLPLKQVQLLLPLNVNNYTDFYASREHAFNCGRIIRGEGNELQANWSHLPVAYHGRASSIVVSGTNLHRPYGQTKAPTASVPSFGLSQRLDYELEMGYVVGGPRTELGERITTADAPNHLFGLTILNDWSSRDIQTWEYVPLGPFLSKNFGTTISPWVVEFAALEPFAVAPPKQDPAVLPYLVDSAGKAYDVQLKVEIAPEKGYYSQVAASNLKHIYWTATQFVAHHTVTGCDLVPGDVMGTGTLSAPHDIDGHSGLGSLLEKSWAGQRPFTLGKGGEQRTWLQDGDSVKMSAWCAGDGYTIGFGSAEGKILPAKAYL